MGTEHCNKCQVLIIAKKSIKDKERIIKQLEKTIQKHRQLTIYFPN